MEWPFKPPTTIGTMSSFFRPVKKRVSEHVFGYFWSMILSICISHGSTIDRLVKSLRNTTHRTNHDEFLWRSNWDESTVMQQIALDMLRSLFTKKDRHMFFIIDDTQTLKRAKKMEAVGKYGTGHTILNVCLYYRGVTIPWASLLYTASD